MGNRYLVSGVQLGMLIALIKEGRSVSAYDFINNELIEKQWLCNSDKPLSEDLQQLRKYLETTAEAGEQDERD